MEEEVDPGLISTSQTPWRRILWARQPFPDNYIPPDFLQKLQSDRESFCSAGRQENSCTDELDDALKSKQQTAYLQRARSLLPTSKSAAQYDTRLCWLLPAPSARPHFCRIISIV